MARNPGRSGWPLFLKREMPPGHPPARPTHRGTNAEVEIAASVGSFSSGDGAEAGTHLVASHLFCGR